MIMVSTAAEITPVRQAFWEWLPGVFGGFLPLIAFVMAYVTGDGKAPDPAAPIDHHFYQSFVSHCLVLTIVTSSVSIMSLLTRSKSGALPNFWSEGRGPVGLVALLLTSAIFGTTLYTIQELTGAHGLMMWLSLLGMAWALVTSYFMEIAIARLHVLSETRLSHPNEQ
jgi:hypothetical protein